MHPYYKVPSCNISASLSLYLIILTISASVYEIYSFQCYVCDSKNDVECMEKLPSDTRLIPQDCSNITDAKYCIKTTNIYAGKIFRQYLVYYTIQILIYLKFQLGEFGTKRFCAANDHGNYCKYIRQPTGDREYRSCVFTCDAENCNTATSLIKFSAFYSSIPCIIFTIIFFKILA